MTEYSLIKTTARKDRKVLGLILFGFTFLLCLCATWINAAGSMISDYSLSPDAIVQCNTTERHEYGIYFGGITPSVFRGNTMYDHYAGLYLNNVAVIDTQTHAGNRWPGTYSSNYGAVNMNDSIQNILISMFTVNPNLSNYNPKIPLNNGNPPFYVDNSLWFDFGSGGTFSCASSTTCNAALTGSDEDIDLRERIANDESLTIEYVPESKSIAKLLLFNELKEDSNLTVGNSTLENFVTANENSNYGYLSAIEQSFKQAMSLPDSMSAVLSSIDSLHNIVIDSLQKASIISNLVIRSSLIYDLNTLNALRISLIDNAQLISKEKLDEASEYFNLITGGDDPVQHLKFVNEVFYQYQRYGINAIIPLYNDIFSVASKCIYKGGEAVIRARTIFSILNDTIQFDDAANCAQFGIYRLVEGIEIEDTTVFIKVNPNPSINTINISVKGIKDGLCDILIENILGQQVYKNYFECKNGFYFADITFLPPAVYTVKVKANGILIKKKIIKLNGIPVLLFVILLSLPLAGKGQGFNKYWLLGGDTGFPMGKIEFEINSYNLIVQQRKMTFKGAQANFSNSNGNLLASSNGIWVANATGDTMKNGSGLAPSYLTSNWPLGLPIPFGDILIPFPGDTNKLILFHSSKWGQFAISKNALYRTIIDLNSDSIIQKNDTILADTLSWGIGACKHANGRDWWLLVSHDGNPRFYTYLITPNGIDTMFVQSVSIAFNTYGNSSPIVFSPDGKKILWCSPHNQTQSGYVMLSDFNRCSGIISNSLILPISQSNYLWGLAFSPSGKMAYGCTSTLMFQINTDNLNVDTVAVYDGFCFPSSPWCTTFWSMYLAANGKIYVTSGSGVQHIHEINFPDSAGVSCDMQQHSIYLNGIWHLRSVPNHPNYYLGCDTTLGCTPCYTKVDELSPPDFKFRVYPNPVSDGLLNIGYLLPQNKSGVFEVYDVTGKVVYRYMLPPWSNFQRFNLTGLHDGIYQCVITSDGKRAVKKVAIIQD